MLRCRLGVVQLQPSRRVVDAGRHAADEFVNLRRTTEAIELRVIRIAVGRHLTEPE